MPIFFQIRLFSCFWDGTVVVSINAVCVIYFILWDYSFLEKKTLLIILIPEVWLKNIIIILLLHSTFIILFWFCFFSLFSALPILFCFMSNWHHCCKLNLPSQQTLPPTTYYWLFLRWNHSYYITEKWGSK